MFPPAVIGMTGRQILRRLLETHYHQPAVCLWRALELLELQATAFPAPVLDLGCGNGDIGDLVLRSHWPVFGLDRVHNETRAAAARAAYAGLVTADAIRLPFPDGRFGAVVSVCVFEHIPEDVRAIHEVARVLRPGGHFVFTTPSVHFEGYLLGSSDRTAVDKVNARLGHFHYRSRAEWEEVLRRAALEPIHHQYLLPRRSQRLWQRLDGLLVSRLAGRRNLDLIRALNRRRLLPRRVWALAWSWALAPLALRRTSPGEPGGGQLIVARKLEQVSSAA